MGSATLTGGPLTKGVVTAHSISSTVELDYDRGTAHKTYAPPFWVRALYRLAFQAPFPYTTNHAALEAARQRRRITGLLTKVWFGRDLVSPVLDIHDEADERHGFVTKLVRGAAPRDKKRARAFLKTLTTRFLEAGLPTWQVTPYNPRSVGNLIEREDGSYRIIDLESNLVAPLMPLSGIVGAIRQGNLPAFDDIDADRLRDYITEHADEIAETLGQREYEALCSAAAAYAKAANEWHEGEPRIISRALRLALKLVDVPTWIRGLRRLSEGSQAKAEAFIRTGIDDWVDEGHVEASEAARLRQALRTPEIASVTTHLGAHIAMSVPLRFPIGSVARAVWTLAMRGKAEWSALRGRGSARSARQVHTLLVALVSLIPGFGAGAYLLAKPLRANQALAVIATDRLLRKLPVRLYARLHLSALMTWFARPATPRAASRRLPATSNVIAGARTRLSELAHHRLFAGAVLGVNAALLILGVMLFEPFETTIVLAEKGLVRTVGDAALLLAGAFGLLAFATFWRCAARRAPASEAAGIFFWGLSGIGLLAFAADDYLTLHQRAGDWIADRFTMVPFADDLNVIVAVSAALLAATVLYVFRHELLAKRHSSVLLLVGAVIASLAIVLDLLVSGGAPAVEFPIQVSAAGLLLLAYVMRYREVSAATRVCQTEGGNGRC